MEITLKAIVNLELHNQDNTFKFRTGENIPYFCLPATDGKIYSASSFHDVKCLVVIFTSNHCPYAKLYEERILEIHRDYKDLSLALVCICSNDGSAFPEDSFDNMKAKNYPFPYLHDETQTVAKAFDAQTTPEAYVFNQDRALVYHGAIDDNPENASLARNKYLREAINSVLGNSLPNITESHVIGCSIKWKIN